MQVLGEANAPVGDERADESVSQSSATSSSHVPLDRRVLLLQVLLKGGAKPP